jgi:hypothetical protein
VSAVDTSAASVELDAACDATAASRRVDRWLGPLVVLLVIAAYLPSLSGTWVWDDVPQYRDNPAITDPWVLVTHDIWGPTGAAQPSNIPVYRPLAMITHAPLQTWLPGPLSERVVNLGLFVAILCGIASLVRALGASPRAAWFGAACVGCHPALTESVAWISCRGELMGVGLVLAGTVALVRGREGWAGLLFALAPFCKETFVLVPLTVAIWMLALRRPAWSALALSVLGAVGYLILRVSLGIPLPAGEEAGMTPWVLLGGIGGVAARGAELFGVPTAPEALPAMHALPWLGAIAVGVALPAHRALPGRPWLAALLGALPLLALAAPASLANGIVSDRYFLSAAIFLGCALGLLYARLESRSHWAPLLVLLPLLWLPFATTRADAWIDNGALFSASLQRDPDNAEALFHYAYYLQTSRHDCEEAAPLYARAMSEVDRAGNNLQACLLELGRPAEAAALGPRLAAADSSNPTPALNTARALTQIGDLVSAERWAREGVRRNGPTAGSVVLLGNIVGMQGRHLEAAALFEQALALDPTSSEARNGLRVARRMAEEAG